MRRLIVFLCVFAVSVACSAEQSSSVQPLPGALTTCQPNAQIQCPCLGSQSLGVQVCNPLGNGYGFCLGCPSPTETHNQPNDAFVFDGADSSVPVADAAPAVDTSPFPADSGDAQLAVDALVPATDGTVPAADAAVPPVDSEGPLAEAATPQVDTGVLEPEFGDINIVAPGISCGVGLPRLCELGAEKCCVRTLDTDTCIAIDATCDCQYAGCQVMEAYCDGPEDCATGEVCCGTISTLVFTNIRYTLIECTAQCNTGMGTQYEVCHQGETECPPGMICANSQLLTNIQVCVDPASIEQ